MRFAASLEIDLPADSIERSRTLLDACRSLLGAKVDLATTRVRTRMEAATFLHQVRAALDALGIDDARFLLVDGMMVFEDARARPDDLTDLMVAFADHVLVASETIRELRLCVEREEAGFVFEIEARFRLEHASEQAAALVSVLGRVIDFAPRPDEGSEAYRARIARVVADAKVIAGLELQFAEFVSRLEHALAVALPGASTRSVVRSLGIDGASMGPALPSSRRVETRHGALPPARPETRRPEPKRRGPDTISPQRNFTLTLEQRIGAALTGPPAFAVRLKKVEDLRESLLVEQHNFAYPIERNLAIDPSTGGFFFAGEPWRPMKRVSIDDLRREAAARRRGDPGP
ncbi:MAG TPA: hypothetical protein VKU41_13545 [Polyangiaceae bacterium]|nr:hypothetical protein [Polyangiaceae bacterium]